MKKIKAQEISKRLPMKVKSLATVGMMVGEKITFTECRDEENKEWQIIGCSDNGKRSLILDPEMEFEEISEGV